MKLMKIVIGLIAVILIGFGVFWGYMGMFSSFDVEEADLGPYTYVYESFVGPYNQTGPVFDSVYKKVEKDGISATSMGIGIYYDNPSVVESSKLRSDCGVILDDSALESLKNQKDRYNVRTMEKTRAMIVRFPLRNSMSYMMGPSVGYPALVKYAEKHGYKMTTPFEIYDMDKSVIMYVMPIQQ